jgi:hypothetical protein
VTYGGSAKEIYSGLNADFTEKKGENVKNNRRIGSGRKITLEGKLREKRNKKVRVGKLFSPLH